MNHFILTISSLQHFAEGCVDTGVTEAAAGSQAAGVTAPDAGEPEGRDAAFHRMITEDYKDLFDAKVQDIIQKRLRDAKQTQQTLDSLTPALKLLSQRYGIPQGDAQALTAALEAEAAAQGPAGQLYDSWVAQSLDTRQQYPGFDLKTELQSPRFRQLLKGGVDVKTAYEVLHREEFLGTAMAHTARAVQQRIASNLASGAARPAENGASCQAGSLSKVDVARMTRQQRQEIIKRAQKGERISF